MKAFVAIDSFKGSLSTIEAGEAVRETLLGAGYATDDVKVFPVSDGGEGFVEVISSYLKGEWRTVEVNGPLGNDISASYYIAEHEGIRTAYIESASVCGYTLVDRNHLDAKKTSSFGLGQMIADADKRGVRRIVVGLGGTCTMDAGVGMLQALGAKFILKDESILPDKAPALFSGIYRMDLSGFHKPEAEIEVWSDTGATMYGRTGASMLYGKQKGLSENEIPRADGWMGAMALIYPGRIRRKEGYGAAGGIGAALATVLGAKMCYGAEEIIGLSLLRENLQAYLPQLLITGEGKFDIQTLTGKLPVWVSAAGLECRKNNKSLLPKIVCLAGKVEWTKTKKFDEIIQITPDGMPLEKALKKETAVNNLKAAIKTRLVTALTVLIMLFSFSPDAGAQETPDNCFGGWIFTKVSRNFENGIYAGAFVQHQNFRFSRLECNYARISAGYKILPWLKAGVNYVPVYEPGDVWKHYAELDVVATFKAGDFKISLRERCRHGFTNGKNELRSNLKVTYSIPDSKFGVYVGPEVFTWGNEWKKSRHYLGGTYDISPWMQFEAFYMYYAFNGSPAENVLGLGLNFNL